MATHEKKKILWNVRFFICVIVGLPLKLIPSSNYLHGCSFFPAANTNHSCTQELFSVSDGWAVFLAFIAA